MSGYALSAQALRDIEGIARHIAEDNLDAALRFYDAAEAAFLRLAEMPGVGVVRFPKHPRLADVRMWPVPGFEKCLVFYQQNQDTVEVVRVLHAARDIERMFE